MRVGTIVRVPYVTTADNARIYCSDSGGDGPTVVAAHGFFMDSTMFAPQAELLSTLGWRVVCWDARGHGATLADPHRRFTYWDCADDTLAVMDALDVERAVLLGMSQGGYTVLRAALKAPQRVDALMLLDTEAGASDEDEQASYRELFDAWCDPQTPLDPLIDGLAPRLIGGTLHDQEPWRTKWADSDREGIRAAADCLIERDSLLDRLGEIGCPALVLRGELDESSTAEKSATLAGGLPGAGPVVTIPGAGHAANWTHPAAVNDAITAFLARSAVSQ